MYPPATWEQDRMISPSRSDSPNGHSLTRLLPSVPYEADQPKHSPVQVNYVNGVAQLFGTKRGSASTLLDYDRSGPSMMYGAGTSEKLAEHSQAWRRRHQQLRT
jgi:hypothetical protein